MPLQGNLPPFGGSFVASLAEVLGGEGVLDGLKPGFWKTVFGFGDVVPLGDHCFEAIGMIGGEIVEFSTVFGEVVEFPAAEFGGGDFPVTGAEGAVFGEVKVEGIVGFACFSCEDGEEGFADEGIDGASTDFFGKGR